jgi:outer membrane biosynthesis protein TonB
MARVDVDAIDGDGLARRGSSRVLRVLKALPMVLLLAVALPVPATAIAAEPLSGYGSEPPRPQPPKTPETAPKPREEGASPERTEKPKEPERKTATSPSSEEGVKPLNEQERGQPVAVAVKARTLPATGFDLRRDVGFGALLMAAGFSILVAQRRRSREHRR